MEVSRAQGEQLRVWSNLLCATETEVPPLNAVAAAVWDGGARGLKEGTGIDCGHGRSEGWIRGGKRERGKLAPLGWNLRPLIQAAGGEIRYSHSLSTLTQD